MKTTFKFTSVLILFSIVCFSGVKAQIIYTDIVPDSLFSLTGSSYQLDLNNDGTPDFKFNFTKSQATSTAHCTSIVYNRNLKVTPLNGGEVANRLYGTINYPPSIYSDTLINDTSYTWSVDSNQLLVNIHYTCAHTGKIYHWVAATTGKWSGATDRYLGLRIDSGGTFYYGWVRLTVGTSSFTIKDYAYNSRPNELIFAGQTLPQHLSVITISGNPFCTSSSVNVPYLAFGAYDTSNVFTAELSDSAGNFTNPISIGSLHSDSSGIINSIIPSSSVVSDLYRIRVTSSSPVLAGIDNGIDLSIQDSITSNHIITYDPTYVCPGSYVQLESSEYYVNVLTYQWTLNGVNIISANSDIYNADTFGVFRCIINNGCGSFISDSIEITSRPLPQANIYALSSLWICPGQTVNLYADTDSTNAYLWFRNGVAIMNAYQSVLTVNQSGLYSIQVTDTFYCENFSQSDSVRVSNPAAVLIAAGPTSICLGDSVLLIQTAYTDTSFTLQWYRDTTAIPGANGQSYSAKLTGLYYIEILNPAGNCKTISSSIDVEVGCLGIEDANGGNNHFVISPNPVSNYITIDKQSKNAAAIQIVDQTGRIVLSDKITGKQKDIDVSNLARGIYIVKITENNYLESKQITIVR